MIYETDDEIKLYFDYSFADTSSVTVDNERHSYKEINKNNTTYYFYESYDENDSSMLIWYDERHSYLITAQLSEEEIVKIAENLIF